MPAAAQPSGSSDNADSVDDFLREVARAPRAAPPAAERDRSGDTIGRFRVAAELGRGGMGVVYLAQDPTLGREVALKVLPVASADAERRQRFLREARAASQITHPSIATVYDVGEDGETVFIAMERVAGKTLRQLLEEQGALAPREAARIVAAAAAGVEQAHAAGIVHRDLKPDNVMLADDGSIKVLDFGLAKLLDPDGPEPAEIVSREGRIVGTPCYMSPEQGRGERVDGRADVFSLGVMLYELCTGARPFSGDTAVATVIAIDRDPHVPARRLRPEIGAALDAIIERCLEKDREWRFQSCAELCDALALAREARPRRKLVWLAALVPLAGLAVAVVTLRPPERAMFAPKIAAAPELTRLLTAPAPSSTPARATPSASAPPVAAPAPRAPKRDPYADQK